MRAREIWIVLYFLSILNDPHKTTRPFVALLSYSNFIIVYDIFLFLIFLWIWNTYKFWSAFPVGFIDMYTNSWQFPRLTDCPVLKPTTTLNTRFKWLRNSVEDNWGKQTLINCINLSSAVYLEVVPKLVLWLHLVQLSLTLTHLETKSAITHVISTQQSRPQSLQASLLVSTKNAMPMWMSKIYQLTYNKKWALGAHLKEVACKNPRSWNRPK